MRYNTCRWRQHGRHYVSLQKITWSTLLGEIRAGRYTLFIGAGASHSALPLAKKLAAKLLEDGEKE
jgi:hypothetical protein